MEEQEEQPDWRTKDASIPLLLSGVVSTVLCLGLCAVLYLSRDFINNDLAPQLGWVDPTPVPVVCPSVPDRWRVVMNNDFDENKYGWSLDEYSDEYEYSELSMEDGLLYYDVRARQPTFSMQTPVSKKVRDFYLSTSVQKLDGPADTEYGVTFSQIGNQVYFFSIQDSGMVKVYFRDEEDAWQGNVVNSYSPNVQAGGRNKLVILSEDNYYRFCINGFVVGETYIDDYQSGEVGVALILQNTGDQAVLQYDDLIVYAP
jgi:hypothetical protein